MIEIVLASLLLGLVAGLLAGLFGIGGGLIIVPILVLLFSAHGFAEKLVMIMSIATSLATIIFTAISSVFTHHRLGAVWWNKVFRLAPGIMVGAAVGAVIADRIAVDVLRFIFIAYLFYVGIHMALQTKPKPGRAEASKFLDFFVAVCIGIMSSLVGIGGGTLTVPYLVHFQAPMRNAVAISSACGLPIAVAGTLSYALLGWNAEQLPKWSLGYVYLPAFVGILASSMLTAPIGARLANKLPALKLKRYFSLLIFVMAIKLMWR
ncbi:MAG: sulfite exporter TauE/SafE family protein [Methylococcaceae bacterium]|nr:sulfite exporter TauE/SafE family protein [Methylococcaceae bacterium]